MPVVATSPSQQKLTGQSQSFWLGALILLAPGTAGYGSDFSTQAGDSRGFLQFGVTDAFPHSCPAIKEDENDLK